MKEKITIAITLALILLLCYSIVSAEDEVPSPSHRFKGYVIKENGDFFPDDTNISALNQNTGLYYYTTVYDGKYGFRNFSAGITEEFQVEGSEGDTILFYIDNNITGQIATFTQEGGYLNDYGSEFFNLSFDTTPPVISSVSTSSITQSQAVVTWTTDENSNSTVNYGKTTSLGSNKLEPSFVTSHTVTLTNLDADNTYYFEVVSYDISSNHATDDNSGNYYTFTTEEATPGNGNGGGGGNGGGTGGGGTTNMPPFADAGGPYYRNIGESINFDASESFDSDGNIVSYKWAFGDQIVETTTNVRISHVYADTGNYTVTLTVTDDIGATNTDTTFAVITLEDIDGDGWSNDAEEYYGTDPNNSSDYPVDADVDGVPDNWDADDDNDGLTDDKEVLIGTDPLVDSDVIRILNDYGLFFLIDTNADGVVDKYYQKGSGLTSDLNTEDEEIFLIDVDNDGVFDYEYSSITGEISLYSEVQPGTEQKENDLTVLLIVAIVIIIIILFILYIRRKK